MDSGDAAEQTASGEQPGTSLKVPTPSAVNVFISAVKSGILTRGSMEIDSLFEPASSGHLRNCSFWHFRVEHSPNMHL